MVVGCGRLGDRWFDSAGRFFVVDKSAVYGAIAVQLGSLGPLEKAIVGNIRDQGEIRVRSGCDQGAIRVRSTEINRST